MDLGWLDEPVLGPDIVLRDLLISGGILLLGIIISPILSGLISKKISKLLGDQQIKAMRRGKLTEDERATEKGHIRTRMRKNLELPLRRGLSISMMIVFFFAAFFSLDIGLGTELTIMNRTYAAWQFLETGVIVGLIVIFTLLAVEPILKALSYSLLSEKYSKARKYHIYRTLRMPVKLTLIVLGSYITINAIFSSRQLEPFFWLTKTLVFLLVILFSYLLAQLFIVLTEQPFKGKDRTSRSAGRAVGKLIRVGIYLVGGLIGLTILGFDLFYIATSLGLIGFALAFGLQDTVANFAAGIMIAVDKPFVIGDRIRIDWGGNETWGDVKDISMRSTWILTPENEMIVIPNSVIASSQVWNYTRDSPKVALHFDVGISYDSDWKLAEKLILEILSRHPLVLNKPPPYVLMKEFGDSAQVLTVWFWIPEARDKVVIQSDILKKIKDAFDRNGVEIPYPYRTLVYKTDIVKPKVLGEPYSSPVYLPSSGYRKFKVEDGEVVEMGMPGSNILAPVSSSYPARRTAPFVMETAGKMGASVTALFIRTPLSDVSEGKKALQIYNSYAKRYGIDIKLLFREGDILENILLAVEEENADLVVMGSTEESMFGRMTRRSISRELLLHLNIPTMIIPITREYGKKRVMEEFEEADLSAMKALESLEKKA